jgi:membrane fusion protein (multidrug efflux system)
VIPESALMVRGDLTSVFTVDAEGKAQVRPVRPGLRLERRVEILEGIQEGDLVITEGIQKVRPGGRVQIGSPSSAPTPPPAG